jgi:hypothetical protein
MMKSMPCCRTNFGRRNSCPMDTRLPDWLSLEGLVDAAEHRALYPYPLLENILSPDDCRSAALNETRAFEDEFGRDLVQPFYRLLWRINTIRDTLTSHTSVSPADRESPFPWAAAFIGSSTIILPRHQLDRHNLQVAQGMAGTLAKVLAESNFIPKDTTGWQIRLFPTRVNLAYEIGLGTPDGSILIPQGSEERPGFAHEFVITGSAGNPTAGCGEMGTSRNVRLRYAGLPARRFSLQALRDCQRTTVTAAVADLGLPG